MNDFLLIGCSAGLRDGLNPCVFAACAVLIVFSRWLSSRSLPAGVFGFIFTLVYAAGVLVFNFGPAPVFLLQKHFVDVARIVYFVLGLGSFVLGVLYLRQWFLLVRGVIPEAPSKPKIRFLSWAGMALVPVTIVLSALMSALQTLWPVNQYVIVLGNETLLRGQWQMVLPMLLAYAVVSVWSLWFIWAFLGIRKMRLSLLKIVSAAVCLTAASCMILLFR